MTDPRAANVQRFREEHGAQQVFILTAVTPFKVSQDRAIIVHMDHSAQLVTCTGCTPRTALGQGIMRDVEPQALFEFLTAVKQSEAAWDHDVTPPDIHDGVTLTVERAGAAGYQRVRIVEPQPDGPHNRLIAAWKAAFPEVRQMLS